LDFKLGDGSDWNAHAIAFIPGGATWREKLAWVEKIFYVRDWSPARTRFWERNEQAVTRPESTFRQRSVGL
jgi:hypothetical protein